MQGVPMHVNSDEIVSHIQKIENVLDIHDLHIWAIDQKSTMLTAHITVPEDICQHDRQEVQTAINLTLKESFQIHHSTLQIEHADPKAVEEHCGC